MLLSNGESIDDSLLAALFGIVWHRPAPGYNRADPMLSLMCCTFKPDA
jgi:hypothetical protein